MDAFLSCDWGTSSFRLRLVQTNGLFIMAEEVNSNGIAKVFKKWTAEKKPESERLFFYQSYLHEQIKKLEKKAGYSLHELPLLVSGMASSSIGMIALPYKELPFKTDGSDLNISVIKPSNHFLNTLILISGAATSDDVMRGEETLLVGCDAEAKESVYIFPGTHSKHIQVRDGEAQQFKTYMTGEFFELLSTKSILCNSVEKDKTSDTAFASPHFEKGILEGRASNLLSSAFHVRTADLFKKHTRSENSEYLSGLVIGAELNELAQKPPPALFLVSGEKLEKKYEWGLTVLGLHKNLNVKSADLTLVKGQLRIYEAIKSDTIPLK